MQNFFTGGEGLASHALGVSTTTIKRDGEEQVNACAKVRCNVFLNLLKNILSCIREVYAVKYRTKVFTTDRASARSVLKTAHGLIYYVTDRISEVNKLFIIWLINPSFLKEAFSSVRYVSMSFSLSWLVNGNSVFFVRFSFFSKI